MNTPRLFSVLAAALSLTLGAVASPEDDAKEAIVDLEVKDMAVAKVIEFVFCAALIPHGGKSE